MSEEAPVTVAAQPAADDVETEKVVKEESVCGETNGELNTLKRGIEEEGEIDGNEGRKQKVERYEEEGVDEENGRSVVRLGPKTFGSSVEMFDYFYKILHSWPPNLDINKYEHTVMLDLLKNGHAEADKKIGVAIKSFQVRYHPLWKNRCFFIIREDNSSDDFSFRKCIDHILPLPENMKAKSSVNKALGGRGGGGNRGRGRGGRGGKQRH